jgi:valyl-tRNA synthetase
VVDAAWTSERGTPVAVNALGELFLPLAGLIDFEAERARLTKELERVKIEVTKVQEKLANPAFAAKVPVKVLEEHQARLQEWQVKEAQIAASLANLAA